MTPAGNFVTRRVSAAETVTKRTNGGLCGAGVIVGWLLRARCLRIFSAGLVCEALVACGGATEVGSVARAELGNEVSPRPSGTAEAPHPAPPEVATMSDATASDMVAVPRAPEPEPDPAESTAGQGSIVLGYADDAPSAEWTFFEQYRGWWKDFAKREVARPKNPLAETVTPRLALQVFGVGPTSEAYRAHRRSFGMYRLCYERALAKHVRGDSWGGVPEGHWVAHVEQASDGRILSLLVIDTSLPDEMSDCLRDEVFYRARGSAEERTLELAFTFHVL